MRVEGGGERNWEGNFSKILPAFIPASTPASTSRSTRSSSPFLAFRHKTEVRRFFNTRLPFCHPQTKFQKSILHYNPECMAVGWVVRKNTVLTSVAWSWRVGRKVGNEQTKQDGGGQRCVYVAFWGIKIFFLVCYNHSLIYFLHFTAFLF